MKMTTSPTDTEIVQQLRAAAKRVFDEGDLDQLTVRRVRQLAESALSLERDYFRNDAQWKLRSKVLIESFGVRSRAIRGESDFFY